MRIVSRRAAFSGRLGGEAQRLPPPTAGDAAPRLMGDVGTGTARSDEKCLFCFPACAILQGRGALVKAWRLELRASQWFIVAL